MFIFKKQTTSRQKMNGGVVGGMNTDSNWQEYERTSLTRKRFFSLLEYLGKVRTSISEWEYLVKTRKDKEA